MIQNPEAVLILGCGIDKTGSLIDDSRASVGQAVNMWRNKLAPLLIASGNVSYKADFLPPISEAQAMKDYALSLGVPFDEMLTELESKDTLGNAVFTRLNLLGPLAIKRVIVVPGPNHSLERLGYVFSKVFGRDISYSFVERAEAKRPKPAEQERERQSLHLLKLWLDAVDDGDVLGVYQVMRAKHPGYK